MPDKRLAAILRPIQSATPAPPYARFRVTGYRIPRTVCPSTTQTQPEMPMITGNFRVIAFADREARAGYHNCAPYSVISRHSDYAAAHAALATERRLSTAVLAIEELGAESCRLWP